ncbi:PH domain-containing protein [Pseudoxanthomonas daejeonensis]|uniref:PH domain-containing protein n=1 Tax=Pseudoxanthomonas daejeonensis TaxID=266062 RepID=UPI001F542756|nr:PH domain-containing protein [Pseudoxanthomonas daejeonensis]UNK58893.1 PH domain-containing protein [Pseudoxanthomonas daejeonensis]
MSDAPASVAVAPGEHRLHPWSWLFVLLQQLRQFIVPLVVLLFAGRRGNTEGWWELAPLIGVGALVAVSLLQYFTYRYRIGRDGITIRSGLLQRSQREIPFARIHNVGLHQSLLHRVFKVAEVRLESAGGQKPEAQMRVLGMDEALALERLVRHRGAEPANPDSTDASIAPADDSHALLALSTAEVVRLGLVSNRGMIVFAAGFGLFWQLFPDERLIARYAEDSFREAAGYAGDLHLGWMGTASAALVAIGVFVFLLRVLSVALALSQYHGFRLSEMQRRLTVERGLFARMRTSVAPRRIQAWFLQETLLHRWLGRRSLRIDTATGGQENDPRKLRELAPIATPEACDALAAHLLPGVAWPPAHWHPLPRNAWWRVFASGAPWTLLLAGVLAWQLGAWGLLALLWLPWSAYAAWRQAGRLGYSIDARLVAVRGGWWSRWWRFAEVDKLQALRLQRSPLDRWLGTASLWMDTAGAGAMSPPLRIRFLPEAEARALYARLGSTLASRRLRW